MNKPDFRPCLPVLLALVASLGLAACGGNDDHPPGVVVTVDDPSRVPASAMSSATAFSAYLTTLPASDSAEPLSVTGLMPPASDSDEPVALR